MRTPRGVLGDFHRPMAAQSRLQVHDVPADGDCLYHCISECAGHMLHVHDRTGAEATAYLRLLVARILERGMWGWHQRMRELGELVSSCSALAVDYPLLQNGHEIDDIIDSVMQPGLYASEVEVKIFEKVLRRKGTALIVVESSSGAHSRSQLLSALRPVCDATCIVLALEMNHYRLLSFDGALIIPKDALCKYLVPRKNE